MPVDVVRIRTLYLEGGMSFERVALVLGNEMGRPVSAGTVRSRYLDAGYRLREDPPIRRGALPDPVVPVRHRTRKVDAR